MKRLALALILLGCGRTQTTNPAGSATPTPATIVSSTPEAGKQASAASTAPGDLTPDDLIRMTAQHVESGLTNQARVEMVMNMLIASGKKRLVSTWDVTPEGGGRYEVTYSIATMSSQKTAAATPVATPTRARGAKNDPFARPTRPKTNSDGVNLSWLVDPAKGSCVPKDERTRLLVSLQPRLDEYGLLSILPEKWRDPASAAAPPPAAPIAGLTTPSPAPSPVAVAPPPEAEIPPADAPPADPIKFEGLIGEDKSKRAIFSQGSSHFDLGPGDRLGKYKVKAIEGDELILLQGQDTTRLIPGQVLPSGGNL